MNTIFLFIFILYKEFHHTPHLRFAPSTATEKSGGKGCKKWVKNLHNSLIFSNFVVDNEGVRKQCYQVRKQSNDPGVLSTRMRKQSNCGESELSMQSYFLCLTL